MGNKLVMARAYGGEPVKLNVISDGERVVYLSNPEKLDDVRHGRLNAIGFPYEDVFIFDERIFQRLRDAWQEGRSTHEIWKTAALY